MYRTLAKMIVSRCDPDVDTGVMLSIGGDIASRISGCMCTGTERTFLQIMQKHRINNFSHREVEACHKELKELATNAKKNKLQLGELNRKDNAVLDCIDALGGAPDYTQEFKKNVEQLAGLLAENDGNRRKRRRI